MSRMGDRAPHQPAHRRLPPNMFQSSSIKYQERFAGAGGTWHLTPTWQRDRHTRGKEAALHVKTFISVALIEVFFKLSLVHVPSERLIARPPTPPFKTSEAPRSCTARQRHGTCQSKRKKVGNARSCIPAIFLNVSSPCSSRAVFYKN